MYFNTVEALDPLADTALVPLILLATVNLASQLTQNNACTDSELFPQLFYETVEDEQELFFFDPADALMQGPTIAVHLAINEQDHKLGSALSIPCMDVNQFLCDLGNDSLFGLDHLFDTRSYVVSTATTMIDARRYQKKMDIDLLRSFILHWK